jgi:hypothetical protein
MKKNTILMSAFLILLFLMNVSSLLAAGNMNWGNIKVNPYFNLRQEYSTNIYLSDGDEKSDLITFFSPGVRFYMLSPNADIQLDYNADILAYWNHNKNNTIRHLLLFKGDWEMGKHYGLFIQNSLSITDDPATSEDTKLEDRLRNLFNVELKRLDRRTTLGVGFTSIRDDYDNIDRLDRTENFVTLDGSYRVMPRTNLSMRYRYGEINYDQNTPSRGASYNELTAGVSGRFSPKITGQVRAGYQWREYETGSAFNGGVVYANAVHQMNPRVKTALSVERGVQESSLAGINYFDYTSVNIDYQHLVAQKHLLKAGAGYQKNDYSETARTDDIWNLMLGWDYNLQQWITLGLVYKLRNRDSSAIDSDYTDNRISVYCRMTF